MKPTLIRASSKVCLRDAYISPMCLSCPNPLCPEPVLRGRGTQGVVGRKNSSPRAHLSEGGRRRALLPLPLGDPPSPHAYLLEVPLCPLHVPSSRGVSSLPAAASHCLPPGPTPSPVFYGRSWTCTEQRHLSHPASTLQPSLTKGTLYWSRVCFLAYLVPRFLHFCVLWFFVFWGFFLDDDFAI